MGFTRAPAGAPHSRGPRVCPSETSFLVGPHSPPGLVQSVRQLGFPQPLFLHGLPHANKKALVSVFAKTRDVFFMSPSDTCLVTSPQKRRTTLWLSLISTSSLTAAHRSPGQLFTESSFLNSSACFQSLIPICLLHKSPRVGLQVLVAKL